MQENKLNLMRPIKAVLIFIISFAATAFIFAAAMYFLESGYAYSPLFATVCLAVGSFFSALYLGNAIGEKGLIIGFIVAGTVFVVSVLVTLLVNSGAVSIHLLLRFVIILLASLIGGIVGVNRKANKKYI